MELENKSYSVEHIIGNDGSKKVVLSLEDFEELLSIVAQHKELLELVQGMAHLEECEDEECEGCGDEEECCDEDEECCGDEENCDKA